MAKAVKRTHGGECLAALGIGTHFLFQLRRRLRRGRFGRGQLRRLVAVNTSRMVLLRGMLDLALTVQARIRILLALIKARIALTVFLVGGLEGRLARYARHNKLRFRFVAHIQNRTLLTHNDACSQRV